MSDTAPFPPAAGSDVRKDSDNAYTSNASVPSTTTQSAGFSLFCRNLRSITMSKLAFDCYRRFTEHPQDTAEAEELKNTMAMENVVKALHNYQHEHNLTNDLSLGMELVTRAGSGYGITPHHQWSIAIPGNNPVKVDLVFVEDMPVPNDKKVSRTAAALFEFSVLREHEPSQKQKKCVKRWYAKFGQGLKYLNYMRAATDTNQAATTRKRRMTIDSDESYTPDDATIKPDDSEEIGDSQKFGYLKLEGPVLFFNITFLLGADQADNEMYLGCFIAQPKAKESDEQFSNVRVALLYRKHAVGSHQIFNSCCEAMKQIFWFKKHREESKVDSGWRYLGPHCALVQESGVKKVYRAYDSRPWVISRSSAVYEDFDLNFSTEVLFDHKDNEEAEGEGDEDEAHIWLFLFRGGVKVISVLFVEGSHVPSCVQHLLDIAEYLLKLHEMNVVHGDIRLLNMVFRGLGSVLIDFDFAGPEDDPRTIYPKKYQQILIDGERPGVQGERITKSDDVMSLIFAFKRVADLPHELLLEPSLENLIKALKAYNGGVRTAHNKNLTKCLLSNSKLLETREGDPVSPAKRGY